MNNTCVLACVHTCRKGSHHTHRVEKHSTKWKGCLPHNLNTQATVEALLSSLPAEAPGAQEESHGVATNGGKFPLIKTYSFKDFRATLFICLVFAGFFVFFVCLSVWRRLDPFSCSTSHHCSHWVPGMGTGLLGPSAASSYTCSLCNDKQGPKYTTGEATALSHCWCTQLSKDEWLKTLSITIFVVILKVDLINKWLLRAAPDNTAWGLDLSLSLVPTSNFQSTKWGLPRVFSEATVNTKETLHSWSPGGYGRKEFCPGKGWVKVCSRHESGS